MPTKMPAPAAQGLGGRWVQDVERAKIRRHAATVRLTHWVNVICFAFLLWSGIGILIAFPQFHWGMVGYVGLEPALKLPIKLDTKYTDWARPMHFAFAWLFVANGILYLAYGFLRGHFARDLAPRRDELKPRNLVAEMTAHLRTAFSRREAEMHYNLAQKIAYCLVIFVLAPVMVLTGLAMSPAFVAAQPWLLDIFGGRQSARFIHFIDVTLLVLFLLVHVSQVFATGFANQIRGMITGRYVIGKADA